MPSPSRLEQLRRQRALLQEHLAWLDREIAGGLTTHRPAPTPGPGTGTSGYRASLPSATSPAAAATGMQAAPGEVGNGSGVNVDELFERLRADEKESAPPSKTGCWIAFAVILLVLICATGATILFIYR
jgi:hypothetical protein